MSAPTERPLDRRTVVRGSSRLWEFLTRFGLGDLGEFSSSDGGWVLEQDEDGPDLKLFPDLPQYLKNLDSIVREDFIDELIFPCAVVGSERRVWVSIYYEPPGITPGGGGGWVYEYPGERDDRELERWVAEDDAREAKAARR